ncbi:MAG: aspartate aminotransferase family protein [Mesorhizobium sp.]
MSRAAAASEESRSILSLNAFDPKADAALEPSLEQLVRRRLENFGASSVLFYREPINAVSARGQFIFSSDGRRYLDFYNNVPSIGHCHPRVAEAVYRQMQMVNSHSRYLYDVVETYAESLLATYPPELSRVVFTCTGSEANDLALRLARCASGGHGVVVTRAAYHGNTASVTEVSPSSYKKSAPPDFVRMVDAPDPNSYGDDLAAGFATAVGKAIDELKAAGHGLACLLVDTIFSSDGVYSDPPGFLAPAVEKVRTEGGLFVADEVQPGFGRTGAGMWGFARHGIVPDIVTMGKPMGNGFPIGGVVSRPGLMEALAEQFGYFNTFGGTPAAAAAGQAVLDVIRDDGLIENARAIGQYLREELATLARGSEVLKEVRGSGLYVGVSVHSAKGGASANDDVAGRIVNRLRERGVLIGIAGEHADVLKIRPPLCVTRDDATALVEQLAAVIRE